jgi:integrase/recombinase XerD
LTTVSHAAEPPIRRAHNKGKKFAPDPLTPHEAQAIIDACPSNKTGIRNRALLTLMYRSGLRVSEALSLRPSSLDFAAHSIRLLDTKSGRAQTRGFHPSAEAALKRWIAVRQGLGLTTGPLFCTLQIHPGQPLSTRYVRWLTADLAKRAGVDKRVHPHIFRHTFAAELWRSGADLAAISKLLGHASIVQTAQYLDHLTNSEAIARLQTFDLPPLDGGKAVPVSQPEDPFDYEQW